MDSLIVTAFGDGWAEATLRGVSLSFVSLEEATDWAHSVGRGVIICIDDES